MLNHYYIEKLFKLEENIVKELDIVGEQIILHTQKDRVATSCPHCQGTHTVVKDYYKRTIHLGIWQAQKVIALHNQRRYYCQSCHHSFSEPIQFVQKYQRQSVREQQSIFEDCRKKISYTDIAQLHHVNTSTVLRIFDSVSCLPPAQLPTVLSIDEFKGNASGQKYQVILTDPVNRKIVDILPKRETEALLQYFRKFSSKQRKQVQFVVMDLSLQFRAIAKRLFPKAHIVADRYHIQRIVTWTMENVRKREQHKLVHYSRRLKQNKRLLLKHPSSITHEDCSKLEEIFAVSPNLKRAYQLRWQFFQLWKQEDSFAVEVWLTKWLLTVKESGIPEFNSLLRSFVQWKEPIIKAATLPYSNGYTEGCNNKTKVLKRIAFGIRRFDRFRNKILLAA